MQLADSERNETDIDWIQEVSVRAADVLTLLAENGRNAKASYAATESLPNQQAKETALKTVAATLAQSISSRGSNTNHGIQSPALKSSYDVSQPKPFEENVPSFLPVMAQLVMMLPNSTELQETFAQLLSLHLFDHILFKVLVQEFKLASEDVNEKSSTTLLVAPKWWNTLSEFLLAGNCSIRSPMEFFCGEDLTTRFHLGNLGQSIEKVLNTLKLLDEKVTSGTVFSLSFIFHMMMESEAKKDLIILILSHCRDTVDKIFSLSILGLSDTIKKEGVLVLETLITRQSVVATFGAIHALPGAQRLMGLYTQKQRAAYELVAKNPFKFILDLLYHPFEESAKGILVPFIAIASQKLADTSMSGDFNNLYENFNRTSKVRSLFVTLTSFGIEVCKTELLLRSDSQALNMIKLVQQEFLNPLPPLAKPNYFFVDRTPPKISENHKSMEPSYDLADLGFSIRCVLATLERIVAKEALEFLNLTQDENLRNKIASRNFRYLFCLFLAILVSQPHTADYGANREECINRISRISKILIETCESYSSMFYASLFNFANDVCHRHTEAIPMVYEELRIVIASHETRNNNELITSSFESFSFNFSCSLGEAAGNNDVINVLQAEYGFLYNKS